MKIKASFLCMNDNFHTLRLSAVCGIVGWLISTSIAHAQSALMDDFRPLPPPISGKDVATEDHDPTSTSVNVNLSAMSAAELTSIFKNYLEQKGVRYTFRAPQDQSPSVSGEGLFKVTVIPPSGSWLDRYEIKDANDTKLVGVRTRVFIENAQSGDKREEDAYGFVSYPEIDLRSVKSVTIEPGVTSVFGQAFGETWTDHDVVVEFRSPIASQFFLKAKFLETTAPKTLRGRSQREHQDAKAPPRKRGTGGASPQRHQGDSYVMRSDQTQAVRWGFATREDAQYAKDLLDAILLAGEQQRDLCRIEKLLSGRPQEEQGKLRRLYNAALGAKERLRDLRDKFLHVHDPENVFAVLYYYATIEGLKKIRQGEMKHPAIMLEEILAFYDAYDLNRSRETREWHWQEYYIKAKELKRNGFGSWTLLMPCDGLLYLGAKAHVVYDLPRALKDVIDRHPEMQGEVQSKELQEDFLSMGYIFHTSSRLAFDDISSVLHQLHPDGMPAGVNMGVPALVAQYKARLDRNTAWDLAKSGYLPTEDSPQHRGDHEALVLEGMELCD